MSRPKDTPPSSVPHPPIWAFITIGLFLAVIVVGYLINPAAR